MLPDHPEFESLIHRFPTKTGTRAIIRLKLTLIMDSCGMSVPFYTYEEDRTDLDVWADNNGSDKLDAYRRKKNAKSIDGLPAIDF